eukprot:403342330
MICNLIKLCFDIQIKQEEGAQPQQNQKIKSKKQQQPKDEDSESDSEQLKRRMRGKKRLSINDYLDDVEDQQAADTNYARKGSKTLSKEFDKKLNTVDDKAPTKDSQLLKKRSKPQTSTSELEQRVKKEYQRNQRNDDSADQKMKKENECNSDTDEDGGIINTKSNQAAKSQEAKQKSSQLNKQPVKDENLKKRREAKQDDKLQRLKNKQKQKKKASRFFEDEACEGDEDEEEEDDEKPNRKIKESEFYTEEQLRVKTQRLDKNFLDNMMKRYDNVKSQGDEGEEDDYDDEDAGYYSEQDEEEDQRQHRRKEEKKDQPLYNRDKRDFIQKYQEAYEKHALKTHGREGLTGQSQLQNSRKARESSDPILKLIANKQKLKDVKVHQQKQVKKEVKDENDADTDDDQVKMEVDEEQARHELTQQEVASHGQLPSIMDSKLWKINCKWGMEKQLVIQLLRKAFDFLNHEKPFMILSIFNCDKTQGCLYIEAYNMSHVKSIIQGMTGIYKQKIDMIPYKEMTQLLKVCSEINETTLQAHQWVRVKNGPYAGDLGFVEMIEGGDRALVKLIPRIRVTQNELGQNVLELYHKAWQKKEFGGVAGQNVPQRLFNPQNVKNECTKDRFEPLQKNFFIWKEQMFRNGFLYYFFKINKLIIDKVEPRLAEVKRFQKDQTHTSTMDYLSDQDEWDIMDDATVMKTIKNDGLQQLEVGDRVEVINKNQKGIKGTILKIDNEEFILIKTLDKVPYELKMKQSEVIKYFECGESVRVIAGTHSGESGIITAIEAKHAVVLMDGATTSENLKILLSNLKSKKEDMEHVKLRDYIQKSVIEIKYNAGEMIMYQSTHCSQLSTSSSSCVNASSTVSGPSLGYIIQVNPDYLKVINSHNQVQMVKQASVTKKIFPRRNTFALDRNHNTIASRSIVKIYDGSQLNGKCAEVKGFCKDVLFVYLKGQLVQTNGIYSILTRNVVLAGQDFVKNVQQENHKGFILGQQDRKQKDRKIIRSYVAITAGEYKGLKGRVLFADELICKVEILAKDLKVQLPRGMVMEIRDPTKPMEIRDLGVEPMSFDDAQKRDMGQEDDEMMIDTTARGQNFMLQQNFANQLDKYDCFGGEAQIATPRGSDKDWGDDDQNLLGGLHREGRDTQISQNFRDCDSQFDLDIAAD